MVRRRLVLLALVLSLPFVALVLRLVSLQLRADFHAEVIRRSQKTRPEILPPERGRILARDGRTVLSRNVPVYEVRFRYQAAHPEPPTHALNPRHRPLRRLVEILQEDAEKSQSTFPSLEAVEARLVEAGERWLAEHDPLRCDPKESGSFVPLIRHVPPSTAKRLARALGDALDDDDSERTGIAMFDVRKAEPGSDAEETYEVWLCVPVALQMEIALGCLARRLGSPEEAATIYAELEDAVQTAVRSMEAAAEREARSHLAGRVAGSRDRGKVYRELEETVQQALRGEDRAVETALARYETRHADADAAGIRGKYEDALRSRFSVDRPLLRRDVPEEVVTAIEYHRDRFRGLEISVSSRRGTGLDLRGLTREEALEKVDAFAPLLGRLERVTGDKLRPLRRRALLERKARDPAAGLTASEAAELEELRQAAPEEYRPLDDLVRAAGAALTEEEFVSFRAGAIRVGELIGARGLEKVYDRRLRGKHGIRLVLVDARGEAYDAVLSVPPEHGADVRTTIDAPLQEALYASLSETIRDPGIQGLAGSAVVLEVDTGAILAAVGVPSVDPGMWYSDAEYRQQMRTRWSRDPKAEKPEEEDARRGYLFHRPFDLPIDPGSVLKLFVAVAALEAAAPWEGDFTPARRYACEEKRFALLPQIRKQCSHNHGEIDLVDAIGESCNHYFFYVGWKHLGAASLWSWARAYGFGALPPGDAPFYGIYADGDLDPSPDAEAGASEGAGDLDRALYAIDLSIGQRCIRATPLQVATAVAAIARSDGLLPTPHLVTPSPPRKIVVRDPKTGKPLQVGLRAPEATLRLVREGMWRAGHSKRGTAYSDSELDPKSALRHFDAAYKTGTAETDRHSSSGAKLYEGWLVGFAPFEKPRIAFAVAIEKTPRYGGDACAPVVRRILEHFAEGSPREYVLAERSRKTEASVRATDG